MKEIEFSKMSFKKPLRGSQRSSWPLDHPLLVAIKNLTPDSDECVETDFMTNSDMSSLYRRIKEVLPKQHRMTFRSVGPRQKHGFAERNKPKRRIFWVETKKEYKEFEEGFESRKAKLKLC